MHVRIERLDEVEIGGRLRRGCFRYRARGRGRRDSGEKAHDLLAKRGAFGGVLEHVADTGVPLLGVGIEVVEQQLAHFHFHQIDQLGVLDRVALVEKHQHVGHADLTRQQHVLFGLRHGAIRCGDDQDRAIHLRRAGNHVLDVVGVAGTIHVGVVPVRRLVLDVRGGNGYAAGFFFRRVVDRVKAAEHDLGIVLLQYLGDGRRQRGLAMIDVTDGANVYVRLAAIKFLFRHWSS